MSEQERPEGRKPERGEQRGGRPAAEIKDLESSPESSDEVRGGACDDGKHYPPVKL